MVKVPVPDKLYRCIVADPPWTYANRPTSATDPTLDAKYRTLSLDEIKDTNVSDISDPDGSVLFLWATMPLLKDALDVLSSWGYTYKTSLCWNKTRWVGVGRWFQVNTELCLIGIRGRVRPFGMQKSNVIYAQPTKHSRKPPEFFDLIDPIIRHHELVPCIELFARERRPQWNSWEAANDR